MLKHVEAASIIYHLSMFFSFLVVVILYPAQLSSDRIVRKNVVIFTQRGRSCSFFGLVSGVAHN